MYVCVCVYIYTHTHVRACVDCRLITPEKVYSNIYMVSYFESEHSPGDGTAIAKRPTTNCEK